MIHVIEILGHLISVLTVFAAVRWYLPSRLQCRLPGKSNLIYILVYTNGQNLTDPLNLLLPNYGINYLINELSKQQHKT